MNHGQKSRWLPTKQQAPAAEAAISADARLRLASISSFHSDGFHFRFKTLLLIEG